LILREEKGDELFLPVGAFLSILGWLVVFRLRPQLAYKQMIWILTGEAVFLLWLCLVKDYRNLEDFKYLFLVGAVALQAAVALFGKEVNGAKLWFDFGFFSFQPVEFVKIFLTIFLAAYLKQNREILDKPIKRENMGLLLRYIIPLLVLWGAAQMVLVVQRDLGMALLLFGTFLGLFYASTRKSGFTALGIALSVGGAFLLYKVFPHMRVRINTWLDPWSTAQDSGYQIVQALYAIANGGLTGAGLGMGEPSHIPAIYTDYIFAAILEELGLWGGLIILSLFLVLIQRMFKSSTNAKDEFSAFLALGLGLIFATQVFVIIAGTVKMIPLTGITLPFISYGGSSIVANFLMLAIFFRISAGCRNRSQQT
jgi:cell division protein FtsW